MPTFPRIAVCASLIFCLDGMAVGQASWQIAYAQQSPAPDYAWAAAFDEVHGEAILMFPELQSNQGWRWDGSAWSQLSGPLPPNRTGSYMVWDAVRQRVVLFGGRVGSQFLQDLWEWDGVAWQQVGAAMPPSRIAAAVAYDRSRGVVVMFGGNSGSLRNDTWEWNGTTWSNPNPAVRPSAREGATMAFDPTTQRVLLYGGQANGVKNSETWTWNGSVWEQHTPVSPPFLRIGQAMVADLARSRVVLYGGSSYDFQTWEWDGDQWHASVPNSPGAWVNSAAWYDSQRNEVGIHGGTSFHTGTMNQTWIYRTANGATSTPFGSGCAGSSGVPLLENVPYTLPWIGDTSTNRVNVAPGELGALFVSSFNSNALPMSLAAIGMPGCDLLLPLDVAEFRQAVSGVAQWSLSIPNSTTFVGVPIYQQAFPFDAAANALGIVSSNGLVMTPGIR